MSDGSQPSEPRTGDSDGRLPDDSPAESVAEQYPRPPLHTEPASAGGSDVPVPFLPPSQRGLSGARHYAADQPYSPRQPAQPVVRPATPRPEDLLVPNHAPETAEPASWGWRGKVHRGTGGLLKPKAGRRERAFRDAILRIRRSFSRPMTVVVIQPKGGAGKTPTTICLSAAFGAHRGGYVVGWDDNETRGTLAVRVANPDDRRTTAWDLLGDLAAFERFDARVGDLGHYVRSQPDAHFDALVSDDHPGNMSQIGEQEYQRLHTVLQRFYRMIVVDTGNNVRSPNWQAAVNSADAVVVVSSYQRDVGYSGSWVLDHLAQTGREQLAANAVTVLTAADPTTDRAVREQLLAHFAARTRAVCEVPYDPQLAHGGPIRWHDLSSASRTAWTLAGATVVDVLVERDEQAIAARREG
ncbi:cobalamin biosynthesis protein CobQ [uncultured Jatrophihabitans sp.]|uniref:cobalamin biosynthesis protein CobQ n=1 Tax=uncultured Jatrophihabitans sp. TaxID=1610747 RepID=UPI0035CC1710